MSVKETVNQGYIYEADFDKVKTERELAVNGSLLHSLIYLISISPTLFCSMSYLSNWTRLSFLFFQMSVSLLDILCMTFDPACSDICLTDNGHIDCRERI